MKKKKIVVLDGYTANPGDLSWEPFKEFGELVVYDRTPKELVFERMQDADYVFTNKAVIDAKTINGCKNLKWIGVLATGYNIVDIEAAAKCGIPVSNIPSYSTDSVAQTVFSHILNITNRVGDYSHSVSGGKWSSCADFSFIDYRHTELAGKTIGIVGYGSIGKRVAAIADAFGMKILVNTPHPGKVSPDYITFTDRETVLRESDIVSLHCPLTEDTKNLINGESLALMKSSAILINTGRGPLVDEYALAAALKEGRIAAAGLDVLVSEPPEADNPLFACENCFITPHVAWASEEARRRLIEIAYSNISEFDAGRPQNVVNGL